MLDQLFPPLQPESITDKKLNAEVPFNVPIHCELKLVEASFNRFPAKPVRVTVPENTNVDPDSNLSVRPEAGEVVKLLNVSLPVMITVPLFDPVIEKL